MSSWGFLAPPSAVAHKEVTVRKKSFAEVVTVENKSFAEAVSGVGDVHLNMLPQRSIRGDSVSIHIS